MCAFIVIDSGWIDIEGFGLWCTQCIRVWNKLETLEGYSVFLWTKPPVSVRIYDNCSLFVLEISFSVTYAVTVLRKNFLFCQPYHFFRLEWIQWKLVPTVNNCYSILDIPFWIFPIFTVYEYSGYNVVLWRFLVW